MSKAGKVKNRAPAPIQISAEQILREAADRQESHVVDPVIKIHDSEEYQSHLRDRRKHFEDNIRYRREHVGNWVKYARFEEDNKELERARSVLERALEVVPTAQSGELWLRYADFELRNEFINRARNVLDRAVQLLPRVDFLWYKYVYVEEMMGDLPKCRAVFERWMKWKPDDNAYFAYAKWEARSGFADKAEAVLRRYVNTYPTAKAFLRFAKYAEFNAQNVTLARTIYESIFEELEPEEAQQAKVFLQFTSFEERQGEYERARVLFQHAIQLFKLGSSDVDAQDDISDWEKKQRQDLYTAYVSFEKKHGDRQGIEMVLLRKQRAAYQSRLKENPHDYDGWFEYAKLEEQHGDAAQVREVYEQAVANVPPFQSNKDHWRRYIYLWIYYAVYEELEQEDLERASQVYQACLDVIPHKSFSFAKIWILAAQLYVRRRDLQAARKLLGKAIGMCGKEKIFLEYIALENSLGEIDRCRALYTNYLKAVPQKASAWISYSNLEKQMGETARCRAIFELAVSQPVLDMPEVLWKAFIDFELEEGEGGRARKLYERLLEKTGHVKVWISFAQFEATEIGRGIEETRKIMERAYEQLKEEGLNEERVLLLDAWRVLEKSKGTPESVKDVENRMPRRVKRKRMRRDEGGNEDGWEEYFDYQFPGEGSAASSLKILEMAAKWKQQQEEDSSDEDEED